MTPPPKPKKRPKLEELTIVDVSVRPPPSKAEQIANSQRRADTITENVAYNIAKRAWQKRKEK